MISSRTATLVVTAALAGALGHGAPAARAADADASAVAVAPGAPGVFLAGSVQSPGDPRSGVAGRWNPARSGFDWLARVNAPPGAADGFTAIVPAGAFVYGISSADGRLAVAKMDAGTGRLRRACGPAGVRLSSLGPPVLPGRAATAGGRIVVVGRTLGQPSRGFIAAVDGGDCRVLRSAVVGAAGPGVDVGFTAIDLDASGSPVVAGFSGAQPAVFRFDGGLLPRGTQTFGAGGAARAAFTDVRVAQDRGIAVGSVGSQLVAQCFTLPALSADARCGPAGLRSLNFHGAGVPAGPATLGRLPSGSWLVAAAQAGPGGSPTSELRPALGAFEPKALRADPRVFGPAGTQVFDPFGAAPSGFSAVTASAAGITGVGNSGPVGSRRPFLFSSRLDGTAPSFTPLAGLATAPPAPVEPAAPPPPPPRPGGAPLLARARFTRMAGRPAADGTFGFLTLTCRRACTARGSYTAPLGGGRTARLGRARARLAAGWRLRVRLALTRRGLRTLARAGRLPVTVRFGVADAAGTRQVVRRTAVIRSRSRS
jgi:hypothetical protein